jgi:putative transposase
MSAYRRYFIPGATYFFTVVTYQRRQFLTGPMARTCLGSALREVRAARPFQTVAMVLMPDHLHAVWSLPRGDADYPTRWARIKETFTLTFLANGGAEGPRSTSQIRRRERAVWQRRYWEHTCRDEDDLQQCIDYIHWNPVKHGLAKDVRDYPWSTFHQYLQRGEYDQDWGQINPCPEADNMGWEWDT